MAPSPIYSNATPSTCSLAHPTCPAPYPASPTPAGHNPSYPLPYTLARTSNGMEMATTRATHQTSTKHSDQHVLDLALVSLNHPVATPSHQAPHPARTRRFTAGRHTVEQLAGAHCAQPPRPAHTRPMRPRPPRSVPHLPRPAGTAPLPPSPRPTPTKLARTPPVHARASPLPATSPSLPRL